MNAPELAGSINRGLAVLEDIDVFLADYRSTHLAAEPPGRPERLVVAQVLENAYTAAETAFLRISQAFENKLRPDRWHGDLLEKMCMDYDWEKLRYLLGVYDRCMPRVRRELLDYAAMAAAGG